jgi:hypothetical protein
MSAKMALAMNVPEQQIVELRDANATKANILAALDRLNRNINPGEKVFIYFSGHGTSYKTSNGCEQGFIPYTQGRYSQKDLISEAELASYTSKISQKADKAVVMVDACFSGGVVSSRTRSISQIADIRAKFSPQSSDQCNVAVNQTVTRSFAPAMQRLGVPQENFVQISAANYNEVSWDNEQLGGLATTVHIDARDHPRGGAAGVDVDIELAGRAGLPCIELEGLGHARRIGVDVGLDPAGAHQRDRSRGGGGCRDGLGVGTGHQRGAGRADDQRAKDE